MILYQIEYNSVLNQSDHDEHYRFIIQPLANQSVIHRPAVSVSSGQLLEIQSLNPNPDPLWQAGNGSQRYVHILISETCECYLLW